MSQYTEWTPELEAFLAAPFPDSCHKQLKKGGAKITFVSWTDYVLRLNDLVGVDGWALDVNLNEIGGRLVCTAKLTILNVCKSNVGDEEEDKAGYGTASTNAFSQAIRRACALFGLGMYLYYDKDGGRGKSSGAIQGAPAEVLTIPNDGREHGGKRFDDSTIPISYFMKRLNDMRYEAATRAAFKAQIEARQKAATSASGATT